MSVAHVVVGPRAAPTSRTLTITSHGALTAYSVGVLRLHKGTGTDSVSGANWTLQHVYLGSGVDDRFASVTFTVGGATVKHRRFNVRSGVSADFILLVDMPASGTIGVTVHYADEGTTTSTDEAVTWWGVDGWERANGTGLVLPYHGLEPTIRYEAGKIRMWYTRSTGATPGQYQDIYYRESSDLGATWTDAALCVSDHGRSFVAVGADAKYHMLTWAKLVPAHMDYYRSDTGAAGTWSLIQADVLGAPPYGTEWGNTCFYHDGAAWQVFVEHMDATTWVTGLWSGAALTSLSVVTDPIVSEAAGPEVQPVAINGKRIMFAGGQYGVFTQGQPRRLDADAIGGPWTSREWWIKVQPYFGLVSGGVPVPDTWDPTKRMGSGSQLADVSHAEIGGRTFVAYEDVNNQAYDHPSLGLAVWDAPLSRIIDPTITHARGDDLVAEGWTVTGEVLSSGAYARKLTKHGTRTEAAAISPVSIEAVALTSGVALERVVSPPQDQISVHALMRAGQTNAIEILRVMTAAGGILLDIRFADTGRLTALAAPGIFIDLGPYVANTYYAIRVDCWTTGYDVYVDGVQKAVGLGYYTAWARPGKAWFGANPNSTMVVNANYWTKLAATAPTWGA